jgi:hypothetical protein
MSLNCTKSNTTNFLYHLIDLELWSSYCYGFGNLFGFSASSGKKFGFSDLARPRSAAVLCVAFLN